MPCELYLSKNVPCSWIGSIVDASCRYFDWSGRHFTVLFPTIDEPRACLKVTSGPPLTFREKAFKVALYVLSFVAAGMLFHPVTSTIRALRATCLLVAAIPAIAGAIKLAVSNYFIQKSENTFSSIQKRENTFKYDPSHSPKFVKACTTEEARKILEEGIEVSDEIKAKLQEALPCLVHYGEGKAAVRKQIENFSHGNSLVFRLKAYPHLIFKTRENYFQPATLPFLTGSYPIPQRFDNMVKAFQIKESYNLDRLQLPHAKMVTIPLTYKAFGKKTTVDIPIIVENYEKHISNVSLQKEFYGRVKDFNPAICQLVCLIAQLHLSDVATHNCPIIESNASATSFSKILLYDLEICEGADIGIAGRDFPYDVDGLIRSLWQKEHVHIAAEEARRQGIAFTHRAHSLETVMREQLKKIEEYEALQKFHAKLNGVSEPIALPTTQEIGLPDILADSVNSLVSYLNETLVKNAESDDSLEYKRRIAIDGELCNSLKAIDKAGNRVSNVNESQLVTILLALRKHGYIFDFNLDGSYMSYIQA